MTAPMDTRVAFHPLQLHAPLGEIIRTLGTGRARVIHSTAIRHVWFESGRVVAITSARDDEKLGSWLVTRGLVPPQSMRNQLAGKSPGERLGSALVRSGLLAADKLRGELESLSLALLARSALAGGELLGEAGTAVTADARTVNAPPRALLIAAARRSEDADQLEKLLGQGRGWVSPDPEGAASDGADLDDSERYLLSLLKRPRTVDNLRRAALIEYPELLRALAVLAVSSLAVPCKVATAPPPSRSASITEDGEPATSGPNPIAQAWTPVTVTATAGEARANLRAALAAIDAEEMASDPIIGDVGAHGYSSADRRRAEALLASAACRLETAGGTQNPRQLLLRALDVYPGLQVTLKLAELEIGEAHLRSQGLERLQKILAQLPRCTPAWLTLARYWIGRGQREKAHACAAKVLAYDLGNEDAKRLLAPGGS